MADLAVLEKAVEGGAVDCCVAPHPNVVFKKNHWTYTLKGKTEKIMSACKYVSFKKYLENDVEDNDEETVRIILLQITHAIRHIEQQQFPIEQLRLRDLQISESKKKIVLLQLSVEPTDDRQITKLKNVFKEILEKKKITSKISKDLLQSIESSSTLEEILQHPYFWRTEKILRFFSAIAQRGKEDQDYRDELKSKLDDPQNYNKIPDFSEDGWIQRLVLDKPKETDKYSAVLRKKIEDKDKKVESDTIRSLTTQRHSAKYDENDGKTKDPYNPESVFSLVNFIRNFSEHFWKQTDNVKACFLFDAIEGYWQFFKERFPNLLHFVYNAVKELEFKDDGLRFFLEEIAPNQDLNLKIKKKSQANVSHNTPHATDPSKPTFADIVKRPSSASK